MDSAEDQTFVDQVRGEQGSYQESEVSNALPSLSQHLS